MKKLKASLVWLLAAGVWLPTLSWWFDPPEPERARADRLAAAHLAAFAEGDSGAQLRDGNPEWDLMRRLFTVLALSSRALRHESERARDLAAIDAILDETLAYTTKHGPHGLLLAYSRRGPFRFAPDRSLFVEGEIATMLAARLVVAHDPQRAATLRHYSARIAEQIGAGPALCGESYPDECWTFCNTTALAALRMADVTLGTDLWQLHHARDPGRFSVSIDAPIPNAAIPPLLLLPLAENAMTHGVWRGGRGAVRLSASRQDDDVRVVIDSPGAYRGPREGGLGLSTVRDRLAIAYGPRGSLDIGADPDDDARTRVTLSFPSKPGP